MSQTKISIPSPHGSNIIGILQQARPLERTQGRPIALIIHGVLAHKDQLYHKRLAEAFVKERGMDSLRYDLRGQGGETEGPWGQSNFNDDVDDLETVISYLANTYGYFIHSLVGHSRGSIISGVYLCTRPHTPIKFFVNLSGRYDFSRFLQRKDYKDAFAKQGYFDWVTKVAGKAVSHRVTPEQVQTFAEWDNSYFITSFPQEMDVLTMHGEADLTVPVADAWDFHRILSQRHPGSHTIKTEPGAGHNWIRPFDEPVNGIMDWFSKVDPLGPAEKSKL
ncbi:hypothetical protein RQP46_009938 [Phenoliferia psychrophenolica]